MLHRTVAALYRLDPAEFLGRIVLGLSEFVIDLIPARKFTSVAGLPFGIFHSQISVFLALVLTVRNGILR